MQKKKDVLEKKRIGQSANLNETIVLTTSISSFPCEEQSSDEDFQQPSTLKEGTPMKKKKLMNKNLISLLNVAK